MRPSSLTNGNFRVHLNDDDDDQEGLIRSRVSSTFLDCNQEPKLPQNLIGDERRFKQVLINLVKNAFKFTTQGHILIKVSYRVEEQVLVVHVEDTGAGIANEDFPKLFTRFGKLKRTADSNSEGIGLGLTIVKSIVELHGGRVAVHSDGLGTGSTFCFSMCMAEQAFNFLEARDDSGPNQQSARPGSSAHSPTFVIGSNKQQRNSNQNSASEFNLVLDRINENSANCSSSSSS